MRKGKTTRKWTEIVRRRKDKEDAESRKRKTRTDRRREAFATMRWRRDVVRDYRLRCASLPEHEAAKQTAEHFGVSISTVRRWHHIYREQGKRSLLPKVGNRVGPKPKITFNIVSFILLLRTYLSWGAIRIAKELADKGICRISHQTVHRIFKKYHVKTRTYHPKGKSNGIRYRRYRKRAHNMMWHLDFAGPFSIASEKVYVLVVIDDYSRFALALEVLPSQETWRVTSVLEQLFAKYGSPDEILTDNSKSFTSAWTTGTHQFDEFCKAHGVVHKLTRPYYPESNGKAESLIKTVKRECLSRLDISSLDEVQLQGELSAYSEYYNWYRLHSALGYSVPSSRYCGVRLKQTLRAVYALQDVSMEDIEAPGDVPQIDKQFIHRHTALALV